MSTKRAATASYGAIIAIPEPTNDTTNARIVPIEEDMDDNSSFKVSHHHRHDVAVPKTATILSEIANITKNLVGGGVLSLSGGIALFADSPFDASICAVCCVVILGAIMGFFCLL